MRWSFIFEGPLFRLLFLQIFQQLFERTELPRLLVKPIMHLANDFIEFDQQTLVVHYRFFQRYDSLLEIGIAWFWLCHRAEYLDAGVALVAVALPELG
jgi:hypothetical protein